MKGKIDKHGALYIKRGAEFKPQLCPMQQEATCSCADWCPLFGEPENRVIAPNPGLWYVSLCQNRKLTFTDFTDERVDK